MNSVIVRCKNERVKPEEERDTPEALKMKASAMAKPAEIADEVIQLVESSKP
jgi:hypothetical protein